MNETAAEQGTDIAIVGVSGRFPGAADPGVLWENLRRGAVGVSRFDDDELRAAGVPEETLADPAYVKAGAVLDGIEMFDADFFGLSPREAQILDPQQRLFLEHSWLALEDAGCDPTRFGGPIGVFAGSAWSSYLLNNLIPDPSLMATMGELAVGLANEKDSLTTRVSHILGLEGPSYSVQSFCSTSLVAVAAAASSLVAEECDLALAGGVSVSVPHRVGYRYQEGGMVSPDGMCRAFDASAQGTPVGSGVALVALRRLEDAVADGDRVYAVIRGWAVNNDAGHKVSFSAPGVRGQASVVVEALASAGLTPVDIDYVETHGTGTSLGDAAELAALQQVYQGQKCLIGSVKTNLGHLDRAAGATGLIKTALALHHSELPATLNFAEPNPQLLRGDAALEVVTDLRRWERSTRPRRAGVSAFGIGGTNAHVVLEEAPPLLGRGGRNRRHQLLVWSARSADAARDLAARLEGRLDREGGESLSDTAYTLQVGRRNFEHRRVLVCSSGDDAVAGLRSESRVLHREEPREDRPMAFLFADSGTDGALAEELLGAEPVLNEEVDRCREHARATGAETNGREAADIELFIAQYALARSFTAWGFSPSVMAGHGVGEYVAACLAGVFSVSDALALIRYRARARAAGTLPTVAEAATWIGGHTRLNEPRSRCLDGGTGHPLTAEHAVSADYWGRRLASSEPLDLLFPPLLADRDLALLDVSPEQTFTAALRGHAGRAPEHEPLLIPARPVADDGSDEKVLAEAVGRLWLTGVPVDWERYQSGRGLRKTSVPTYPFERERYWIDPPASGRETTSAGKSPTSTAPQRPSRGDVRLTTRTWREAVDGAQRTPAGRYLLFADGTGVAERLHRELNDQGAKTVLVYAGDAFTSDPTRKTIRPGQPQDYTRLLKEVAGEEPGSGLSVLHLWPLESGGRGIARERGFLSVRALLTAIDEIGADVHRVLVATRAGQAVTPEETADPEQAALAALCVVARQEYPGLDCRTVDFAAAETDPKRLASVLSRESATGETRTVAAHREGRLLVADYTAADLSPGPGSTRIKTGGSYLITGGLGEVGLLVAEHLAAAGAERLVLTGRDGALSTAARRDAVERLHGTGVEVVIAAADVTDVARMREIVTEAVGSTRLDGVFHAAGITDPSAFQPMRQTTPDLVERHFRPKLDGARALRRVIGELPREQAPDFCLLFSSISATLGGIGFASYAAANAAMSATTTGGSGNGVRWISVEWDTWAPTAERAGAAGLGASMAEHSMSAADALAALDETLGSTLHHAVAAVGDLTARLRTWADSAVAESAPTERFARPDIAQPYVPPATPTQRRVAEAWGDVLGLDRVGTRDNFFDLGGNSMLALQVLTLVKNRMGAALPAVALFEAPTVHDLAELIDQRNEPAEQAPPPKAARPRPPEEKAAPRVRRAPAPTASTPVVKEDGTDQRIAIVGMAGRFPGARDVPGFWRNLVDGTESISALTEEELAASGVAPDLLANPDYVRARPVLDDIRGFDAGFFGYSPRAAAFTDPQQRVFLEICWEAMEHAGYGGSGHREGTGVFGGTNLSTYLLNAYDTLRDSGDLNDYEAVMGNDKDALTTTVSYTLDLRGPSFSVQTFCSTSLVAVHLACQSLRADECDLALAGGVSIRVPDRVGHLYQPGGMASPDGHVRTFDADARGSMFGDGAAVVVLKRLDDAIRDRDTIWSVIRGSAINNDGALKVGYTAPSVAQQARVVADAIADAQVDPEDISYVEAHGTGTELGDPIEVAALTRAFGPTTRKQYCLIGSAKTNVGHLDRAAGVTGLIKTALALRSGVIPPTLHFTKPNPEIDFADSPFHVNTETVAWPDQEGKPRLAGLNSLGMGGTNVHVVMEEPPATPADGSTPEDAPRRHQVLAVSARTETAADQACERLGRALLADDAPNLVDTAYTLHVGREVFQHRRALVTETAHEAGKALTGERGASGVQLLTRADATRGRPVSFVFAGVGEQYPGMVAELHRREPVFRAAFDECAAVLRELRPEIDVVGPLTGERAANRSLAEMLGREQQESDPRAAGLRDTAVAQPAVFAAEYALARTLMEWGLEPGVMLGYSLGEYVAACLAGVLSLREALALVAYRAELISGLAPSSMLAVSLDAHQLAARFGPLEERGLDIAVLSGTETVVVAGSTDAVRELDRELRDAEVPSRMLDTTHAFHSRELEPLREELTEWVRANITPRPPRLPYISNVTGTIADAELVIDPGYWARHMCETVRFADGVRALLDNPDLAVVEIGPGQSLGAMMRASGAEPGRWSLIVPTLPAAMERRSDDGSLADCLARLWLAGVDVDWEAYHRSASPTGSGGPRRVPLPTYPFQRQDYWIEAAPRTAATDRKQTGEPVPPSGSLLEEVNGLATLPEERWTHVPVWRQLPPAPVGGDVSGDWLVYVDSGTGRGLSAELAEAVPGGRITQVRPGTEFAEEDGGYRVRPGSLEDTLAMLRGLRAANRLPDRVLHLWLLGEPTGEEPEEEAFERGLHTLAALARSASEVGMEHWALDVVCSRTQKVLPDDAALPERATVTGPCLVIPLEYPKVRARLIDVSERDGDSARLLAEVAHTTGEPLVALRGGQRWTCDYQSMPTPNPDPSGQEPAPAPLRTEGVYLVTGGLGGIGLAMAERLARSCRARLVLFGRTGLPPEDTWDEVLAAPDTNTGAAEARRRIAGVRRLLELGSEVEIVTGDIAEEKDAKRAVDAAYDRFGALHGVLHAAGVPAMGLMQFKRPEDFERVLKPKTGGVRALVSALSRREAARSGPDFCVLFSSITSATGGGPGQVDYCAANAYLDAFAQNSGDLDCPVVSIGWGEWTWNAWEEGLAGYDPALQEFFRANRARVGIGFDQGWRALLRVLASGQNRVIVSSQDFAELVRLSRYFTVDLVRSPIGAVEGTRHERPALASPYLTPQTSTERTIAQVWADTLKLDRVGVADSFFELGGNSLIGVDIVARLRAELGVEELAPHVLYEAPTVEALAAFVDRRVAAAVDGTTDSDQTQEIQDRARRRRSGLRSNAQQRRRSDR